MADILLELREITKQFPGVTANDHVSFDLRDGEVHALVGENGAGKTTLMKILYGLYRPDSGSISVDGASIAIRGPRDAISRGIGMVHQHFMLFPPFTVLENIVIGEEAQRAGILATHVQHSRVEAIMKENGITVPLDAKVEDLAVGLQQRVEILKILFRGAKILIFDEPTAVLTPQEVNELFRTFRALTAHGKGIIFITHKLDEVLAVADRITVIRQGRVVRTMDRAGVTKPMIAELMVGKPVLMEVDRPPLEAGRTVLEVRDLKVRSARGFAAVDGLSFSVKAGEIYGIAGVEGNGQSELVHAIAEGIGVEGGDILLEGENVHRWSVRRRREHGIAHIPEDRLKYGLLLPFSIATNLTLGRHDKAPFVTRLQTVNRRAVRESARRIIQQYDIRTPSENTPANALSGGNQQKAVVARELSAEPRLLLASQPTRGVDIGATEFIHRQIMKARTEGKAVLLVSADLDELLALSDRIGVIFKGRIIREFTHENALREEVGLSMTGGQSMRQRKRRFSSYVILAQAAPFMGFLASMAVLLAIVIFMREDPLKAFEAIYKFSMSSAAKLGAVVSISIPYYLSGLSIAIAFRAGVFNIGNEGQYFVGGLLGAVAGIYLPLPAPLHLPVVVLAAMLGGALWALVPAVLKASRGISEVITTIMFNNIGLALVNFLVNGPLSGMAKGVSLEPQTKKILPTALFGKLNGLFRSLGWKVPDYVYLDYSLIVAIVMGAVIWFLLFRTRQGFEIRAVGTSVDVSRYAGIKVQRVQIAAFLLSGAIAGLIGLQEIFAIRGFYTYNIASGLGFDGIAISLIAQNHPVGVVFSSVLFAFLKQAGYGLQLSTKVPNSVTYAIQGLMILFIVAINAVIVRAVRSLRKKELS